MPLAIGEGKYAEMHHRCASVQIRGFRMAIRLLNSGAYD